MSTDRELLELAAKAAGIPVIFEDDGVPCEPYLSTQGGTWSEDWNPLFDDGDALRLAVKRRFHINIFSATEADGINAPGFVEIWDDGDDPIHVEWVEGADYETATRRAIVRAAAELGRKS